MLKKAVRYSLRRLRDWLKEVEREREQEPASPDFERDEFLYPWLNAQYSKIIKYGLRRRDYAWGVLQGVNLAKALGIQRVSVIEFGVAGGRSLLELETIAERVEAVFGIGIDVFGFDRGVGLPKPEDYRDTPNLILEGYFPMDEKKLRSRLKRAHLFLGSLDSTIGDFIANRPAPVAFVAVDLVLYTSTLQALKLFDAEHALLLPRVHAYFDDVFGFTFGDCNGELLAISEFNNTHEKRKVSRINGLRYFLPELVANAAWTERFWIAHIFDHPLYMQYDGLVKRGTLNIDEWN